METPCVAVARSYRQPSWATTQTSTGPRQLNMAAGRRRAASASCARIRGHTNSGACPFSCGRAQPDQLLGAPSEALAGVGAADPWEAARRPAVGPQASPKGQADRRARDRVRCLRQQAGPCCGAVSQRHHSITAISTSRPLLMHATTFDTNSLSLRRSTAAL